MRHEVFLSERSVNRETGRSHYTHKKLRSAYHSLKRHLPWLFTFENVFIDFVAGLPKKPKPPFADGYSAYARSFSKAVCVLFQPGKTAPYHPPLRQYHKTVQSVAFGNSYPRTSQFLHRQRKCSACVATVGKEFLYRTKMIPLTFQCHQAAFSHGCRDYKHVLRISLR